MTDINSISISHYVEPIADELDLEIRNLFILCFPNSINLTKRRYNNEMPSERWIARYHGEVVGNLALHHKLLFDNDDCSFPFIAVAEVCLHPEVRGFGLVGELLKRAEAAYKTVDYSVLFGEANIYEKYGYKTVSNVCFPESEKETNHVMMKNISNPVWPSGIIKINGQHF